jgi:hypothetical protein
MLTKFSRELKFSFAEIDYFIVESKMLPIVNSYKTLAFNTDVVMQQTSAQLQY